MNVYTSHLLFPDKLRSSDQSVSYFICPSTSSTRELVSNLYYKCKEALRLVIVCLPFSHSYSVDTEEERETAFFGKRPTVLIEDRLRVQNT